MNIIKRTQKLAEEHRKKLSTKSTPSATKVSCAEVDRLAARYVELGSEQIAISAERDQCKETLIDLARKEGIKQGKRKIVYGSAFVAGYTTTAPTLGVDYQKLLKALTPKQRAAVVVESVDDAKLERAVKNGLIPMALVQKFKTEMRPAGERFYVQTIKGGTLSGI